MLRYRVKIALVPDETVSLNEYKVTLAGSDIDITDAVMRNDDIEALIEKAEDDLQDFDTESNNRDHLDYYKKDDSSRGNSSSYKSNGDHRSHLPERGSRSGNNRNKSKSKYYKTSDS
jgi:ribonuclease G